MTGISSMTGYARASASIPGAEVLVEIRAVNGRGLDLRLRLAPGFDVLDGEIRKRLSRAITRGSITISLSVDREGEGGKVVVNHQALEAIIEGLEWLAPRVTAAPPRLDGLLALKGVIEQHQTPLEPHEEEQLTVAILDAVDRALIGLVAARREEGARIAAVLSDRITEIETLAAAAEAHPSRSKEAIHARLRQQLAQLVDAGAPVAEDRLAQEAMLAFTRADIREELDRLGAHVAAARQLLKAGGPVGRKLDFLSQEFNREANTLCSKSNDVELTAIGLDLKAVIDQLREQVQNIE